MSDRVSDVDDNDLTKVEGVPVTEPVTPSNSEASAANADEAAAPGTESGAGDVDAPGLVQGLSDLAESEHELPVRRVRRRDSARRDVRKSSELVAAEAEAAESDIRLSPAEERDVRETTSSAEDAAELRQELLREKQQAESLRQLKRRVNPTVPMHILSSRPSYGSATATIEYHTREAFGFLVGRSRSIGKLSELVRVGEDVQKRDLPADNDRQVKSSITGLFESNSKLREVVQGHYAGCPYATWYLLKIEEELRFIRDQVKVIEAQADTILDGVTNLNVDRLTVRLPTVIRLTFHSPYGYHFADLLVAYDNLIRKVKPYMMMNFIEFAEYRRIERSLGTHLRRLFRLPMEWRFVGRDAVVQKTAQLFAAEHQMGMLPEDILNGERVPTMVRSNR